MVRLNTVCADTQYLAKSRVTKKSHERQQCTPYITAPNTVHSTLFLATGVMEAYASNRTYWHEYA